jgi:hypothetical protein
MQTEQVISSTRYWLQQVVVGLQLCPFASQPLRQDSIRYQVCEHSDDNAIYAALLDEIIAFPGLPVQQAETALFIVPQGLRRFDDYLDLLHAAEAGIDASGLSGTLQLASFHPDYRFAGSSADDAANYSNRSPYPMFHLLRESLMEQALANFPQPEAIPERNIRRLRKLGLQHMQQQLAACQGQADQACSNQIRPDQANPGPARQA